MLKKYTFLLLLSTQIILAKNSSLRFTPSHTFKIAQFTDLHWDELSAESAVTEMTIKMVLHEEKPQLAILTGDVVTAPPAKAGWLRIAHIFEETKTPWAVVLGNHDAETDLSAKEIFNLLEGLPYFVGKKGDEISGVGNYALNILSSEDVSTAAVLYCIDSHNKPEQYKYGHYDWIRFDQIAWYRQNSQNYTEANGNIPLPSLAFFHIPIPEFKHIELKKGTFGNKMEGVTSSDINSGIFASFVEMKDVMGVFVGHDHNNDYIGIEHDIALGFGRTTGADAYGKLERGARIIQLYEDRFQFDTWIRTTNIKELIYYFPSGISSDDESTMQYHPSLNNVKKGKHGLHYIYYEGGTLRKIDDIKTNANMIKEGVVENFTLSPALVPDSFAFVFEGLIEIPENGIYNFYTFSDDGSALYIDDMKVVDNDGSHSLQRREGKIALKAGLHKIKVIYFENYMGEHLEVGWSAKSIREEKIPSHVLYLLKQR